MDETEWVGASTMDLDADRQHAVSRHLRALVDSLALASKPPAPTPWIFATPPLPEKPVKRMDEMRLADYRKGVDAWWTKRPRG